MLRFWRSLVANDAEGQQSRNGWREAPLALLLSRHDGVTRDDGPMDGVRSTRSIFATPQPRGGASSTTE